MAVQYLPDLPQKRDVPIGCIGAGFIMADCHLVAYRQAGFHPVAISSRTIERANEVASRHAIPQTFASYQELIRESGAEVIDIAVPPDIQIEVVREVAAHSVANGGSIRGVLAQKPLGVDYDEAVEIVSLCEAAGLTLAVNQNMRFDQSIRAAKSLLDGGELGEPVLATIEMRAIPHWMPWQQRQGWVTLRIMTIHHLDTFRYWFGTPARVFASVRRDPRTTFAHEDGIALSVLEYDSGLRASSWDDVWTGPAREGAESDVGIRWRLEGTRGLAMGTIGWPSYPERTPSTIDFTTTAHPDWQRPRWDEVWFPDAFTGPMADLLIALETNTQPPINGRDNLETMALVEACYRSVAEHRAVEIGEITG